MIRRFQKALRNLRGVLTIINLCSHTVQLRINAFFSPLKMNWSYSCLLTALFILTCYMSPKYQTLVSNKYSFFEELFVFEIMPNNTFSETIEKICIFFPLAFFWAHGKTNFASVNNKTITQICETDIKTIIYLYSN